MRVSRSHHTYCCCHNITIIIVTISLFSSCFPLSPSQDYYCCYCYDEQFLYCCNCSEQAGDSSLMDSSLTWNLEMSMSRSLQPRHSQKAATMRANLPALSCRSFTLALVVPYLVATSSCGTCSIKACSDAVRQSYSLAGLCAKVDSMVLYDSLGLSPWTYVVHLCRCLACAY